MSANLTDADCRAVALLLGDAERPPWLVRRFAALDQLNREGRIQAIRDAGDGPQAWARVLDAAANLEAAPVARAARVRGKGGRPRNSRGPAWPHMVWAILGALEGGGRRVSDVARRVGRGPGQVLQALCHLSEHGAVERSGKRWRLVCHGRPW